MISPQQKKKQMIAALQTSNGTEENFMLGGIGHDGKLVVLKEPFNPSDFISYKLLDIQRFVLILGHLESNILEFIFHNPYFCFPPVSQTNRMNLHWIVKHTIYVEFITYFPENVEQLNTFLWNLNRKVSFVTEFLTHSYPLGFLLLDNGEIYDTADYANDIFRTIDSLTFPTFHTCYTMDGNLLRNYNYNPENIGLSCSELPSHAIVCLQLLFTSLSQFSSNLGIRIQIFNQDDPILSFLKNIWLERWWWYSFNENGEPASKEEMKKLVIQNCSQGIAEGFHFACSVALCPRIFYERLESPREGILVPGACSLIQYEFFREIYDDYPNLICNPIPEITDFEKEILNPNFTFSHRKLTKMMHHYLGNSQGVIFKQVRTLLFGSPISYLSKLPTASPVPKHHVLFFIRGGGYQPERNTELVEIKEFITYCFRVQKIGILFGSSPPLDSNLTEMMKRNQVLNFTEHWRKSDYWIEAIEAKWKVNISDFSPFRKQLWILLFIRKQYNVQFAIGTWSGALESIVISGIPTIRILDPSLTDSRITRVKQWISVMNKEYRAIPKADFNADQLIRIISNFEEQLRI